MTSLKDKMLGDIRGGLMKPGDRLPTERALALQLGISRSAVRKDLDDLERAGHIRRWVGRGTFVAEARSSLPQGVFAEIDQLSPGEVTRARLLFEPQVAALAAVDATRQDLQKMKDCVERSEAATTVPEFDYWDGAFHLAIADATQNNFVRLICSHVQRVRTEAEWGRLKFVSVTAERRLLYEKDHRDILNALLERDSDGARRATEIHLNRVVDFLFSRQ
ncbi:FadR/GntR family transcriptional regulator [Chelatococcus sp. GCM10030263]|uniref:FadR/GntR family transcriptional regulator n=1 Tax=Chelatococcus sp. GCM10030263 TaxID=3273387 RepID=UPI0036239523